MVRLKRYGAKAHEEGSTIMVVYRQKPVLLVDKKHMLFSMTRRGFGITRTLNKAAHKFGLNFRVIWDGKRPYVLHKIGVDHAHVEVWKRTPLNDNLVLERKK